MLNRITEIKNKEIQGKYAPMAGDIEKLQVAIYMARLI